MTGETCSRCHQQVPADPESDSPARSESFQPRSHSLCLCWQSRHTTASVLQLHSGVPPGCGQEGWGGEEGGGGRRDGGERENRRDGGERER